MTDVEKQVEGIFKAVEGYVDDRIRHSDGQLNSWAAEVFKSIEDRFEQRLAALEQARTMRFVGPYDPAVASYGAGAVVQRQGSTWVALCPTSAKPGDSSDWRRIGSDR